MTDIDMDGALVVKKNMEALPEDQRVPLIFFALITHEIEALRINIFDRTYQTDEDKKARWEGDLKEMPEIHKHIDEGFFTQV